MSKRAVARIIDCEEDLGEVAEWVERSAAQKQDDDDFDVAVVDQNKEAMEDARRRINEKLQSKGTQLSRRSGPLVNNLRSKAKQMALQSQVPKEEENIMKFDSDKEEDNIHEQPTSPQESPDKKVFRVSVRSLENKDQKEQNIMEDEFVEANKQRLIEFQKPKQEMRQLNFVDAWDALKQEEHLRESIKFLERKKTSFSEKLFGCFQVHLKSTRLIQEKNQIIGLTFLSFDDTISIHFQVMYSVYCQFMDTDHCLRYGGHWEQIGFQGRDPATDLRGAGMLGLLQILAFLQHYKIYIQSCLQYSQKNTFPLSITLINITTFVLVALKDNKLNSLINKEESVLSVVNKLYFAGFFQFFRMYQNQNGNFHTIGRMLQAVRKLIYESPHHLITEFQKGITLFYKTNQ
ncbi:ELMO domain-containing protein 3 [Paramecium bursaria]